MTANNHPRTDTVEGRIELAIRHLRKQGNSLAQAEEHINSLVDKLNLPVAPDAVSRLLQQVYHGDGQPAKQPAVKQPANIEAPGGRLLSLRQAARYSGLSYWLLRDWCRGGVLPVVQLPGTMVKRRNGNDSWPAEHVIRKFLIDRLDLDEVIADAKTIQNFTAKKRG